MQRSGSQKALLVFSIIELIGAVISLITGIMAVVGAGVVAGDASVAAGSGVTQAQGVAAFGIIAILLIVTGVWSLLCGLFGIRAANDNQKIMIVWVFCLIGVILGLISIVVSIVQGQFGNQALSLICSMVFPCIMFFIANNIKKEAGL